MLSVVYKPGFLRSWKKLPSALQDEVLEKIELFKDPRNHQHLRVHKLHGPLAGSYSFSVNYQWRVVFEWLSKREAVLLAVGDHDVYR